MAMVPSSQNRWILRIFALGFIYGCTAVAWFILGGSILSRTDSADRMLKSRVEGLWGTPLEQPAPKTQPPSDKPAF